MRLVNDLMIEDMFDSIESHALFTPIMLECIKAKESRPEKVRTFLDYLQRRGPNAFETFIQCLRETGHEFVISYVIEVYLGIKGKTLPMKSNEYLTQETQGHMSNFVMETQGSSLGQMSNPVMETQRSFQGQLSNSVMETQGSGDAEIKEEEMQEDNVEDAAMDEVPSNILENESNIPDSSPQGTYSSTSGPQSNQLGQFSSHVVTMTGYTGNFKEEYRMETEPRGLLLIINNQEFEGGLSKRDGTDVDCNKLRELFMSLGFGVDVRRNLTAREIKDTLATLSRHQMLQRVDSLAIALLTHGSEDFLYGVDANYFSVNEAFLPFTAEQCPALHHKPKFFIINACRGDAEDKGSITHSSDKSGTAHDVTNIPPQSRNILMSNLFPGECETNSVTHDVQTMPPEPRNSRIPNMKDFLVAFSTIPGHVSWRHMNDGSFFIQGFVKIFQEFAHTTDVLKMLVKVNNEVSKNIQHQGVQIPAPQVMLTKTWYLNPKRTDI